MPGFLKQATASQSRALGPFVDDTDFKTTKTGLTIANTDIKLVVNGGASANKNSGGGTHRVNGVYGVTFDATDTATVGEIEVSVVVAGALPVFDKFFVVEEAVYDGLFAASALGYQVPIWAAANSSVTLSNTTIKAVSDMAAVPGEVTTIGIQVDSMFGDGVSVATGGIASTSFAAGAIDATAIAANAIGASELAADAVAEIADGILDRDMSTGVDSGSTTVRTMRQALRFLRNKWAIVAGTLTVCKEDDSTTSWTSAVTGTAGADPVTGTDPAGP